MRNFIYSFLVFFISIFTFQSVSFAAPDATKSPISVASKLYWAARLMDNNKNWPKISELLREVLTTDLENDFVKSRVKQVKQYVDNEEARQAKSKFLNSRLQTFSFLEARLLLVECIQEMRPRLNRSWDGEVRHFKKLIMSALFPHMEEYAEIEFPDPKKYSFDLYGYTMRNLKALMIATGGEELEPLFPEFIAEDQKKKTRIDDWDVNGFSHIARLTSFRDRIGKNLMAEGIDQKHLLPSGWNPQDSGWTPSKWDDDWDWGGGGYSGDNKIATLKRAYLYLTKAIIMLNNHRSVDEYEPLTLLMIAVSNPQMIDEDPQLHDFVEGIKFKFAIAKDGAEGEGFKPHDYNLVQSVNDALSPDSNLALKFEVDSRSKQRWLYLVSNTNGNSNLLANMLSIRNAVTAIQATKYMPEAVWSNLKATPEAMSKLAKGIETVIQGWKGVNNPVIRWGSYPAEVAFKVIITVGGKSVSKIAAVTGKYVQALIANEKVIKVVNVAKSENFIRGLIGLSVALDVTEGWIEYYSTPSSLHQADILSRTVGRVGGSLLYLVKNNRALILYIAALDLGHMFFDKVPSTSILLEKAFKLAYLKAYKQVKGASLIQVEMNKIKSQLVIQNETEALGMLEAYEKGITEAKTLQDMEKARAEFDTKLGLYAARRVVFHYVMTSVLNNGSDQDFAEEMKTQGIEYDRMNKLAIYTNPGAAKEQMGRAALDIAYDEKWVKLGGVLPEKPRMKPQKPKPEDKDSEKKKEPTPPGNGNGDSGKPPRKPNPWEDPNEVKP